MTNELKDRTISIPFSQINRSNGKTILCGGSIEIIDGIAFICDDEEGYIHVPGVTNQEQLNVLLSLLGIKEKS